MAESRLSALPRPSGKSGHSFRSPSIDRRRPGTPCYALIWEGAIGAFYKIDAELNITLLGDVLHEPGNRYTAIYGLADPSFPKK